MICVPNNFDVSLLRVQYVNPTITTPNQTVYAISQNIFSLGFSFVYNGDVNSRTIGYTGIVTMVPIFAGTLKQQDYKTNYNQTGAGVSRNIQIQVKEATYQPVMLYCDGGLFFWKNILIAGDTTANIEITHYYIDCGNQNPLNDQ